MAKHRRSMATPTAETAENATIHEWKQKMEYELKGWGGTNYGDELVLWVLSTRLLGLPGPCARSTNLHPFCLAPACP